MDMNGFSMMADSYRKLLEQGRINREIGEKEIRIYDFLSECNQDDFCRMVDSSAFNDIIKAYLTYAVNHADIDEEARNKILSQIRWIFDEKTAKEVLENA